MDPLVRSTLALQRLLAKAAGLGLSIGFGVYLVCWAGDPPPELNNWVAFGAYLLVTLFHVGRRLRHLPDEVVKLDLELMTMLSAGLYLVILKSPGGLGGPVYPAAYAFMMLVGGFARPGAAVGTLAYSIVLETALHYVAFGERSAERLLLHASLLCVFAFLNLVLFRGEIARVRRLSKLRIQAEIEKMRESARAYRLLSAPSPDRPSPSRDDEERLLQSGVDEVHQALEFALDLLRRSLKLRTAVLLGFDPKGTSLRVQEASSDDDTIAPGPFSAKDGIFAAALAQGHPISVLGSRAAAQAPYYSVRVAIGAVCAVPVLEHGHARGILVVDRVEREPFTSEEEATLVAATHFVLRAIENERVFVQMERAKIEQGKLYRAAEALSGATTEAAVIEAGVSSAREFAAFDLAVVTLADRSTQTHEICAASGPGAERLAGQRFRHNSGLVSMAVANRHPLPYRGEYDADRQVVFTRQIKPPQMPSLLVLPLLVHERALGTLVLGSQRRHAFGDAVRPTLEVLASHIAVSLANARMLKRLEELATTDGLTGHLNKRALTEVGIQKLKSASRFKKPLSVLICDIDHFKRVNDTHGHDMGDIVIKGFADVLRRAKRDTDFVGRFGGEEFVLVCEETNEDGGKLLAERIRAELEEASFHTESGPLKVTCSVGVATFPAAGERWEAMFKSADEALYASKRGGRNRVTLWSPRLQGAA
jgi:two-component system, cell cycle response regulator